MAEMPTAATSLSPAPATRATVAGAYALSASRARTSAPAFQPTLRATLEDPALPSPRSLEPFAGESTRDELAGGDGPGGDTAGQSRQQMQRAVTPFAARAHRAAALRSSSR